MIGDNDPPLESVEGERLVRLPDGTVTHFIESIIQFFYNFDK